MKIRLFVGLFLVLWLGLPAALPAGTVAEKPAASQAKVQLRFTKHALARMKGRGVTEEQVRKTVGENAPFQYWHQGRWKTGYYDAKTGIFVATNEGAVITVISDATPRYIADLKAKRP